MSTIEPMPKVTPRIRRAVELNRQGLQHTEIAKELGYANASGVTHALRSAGARSYTQWLAKQHKGEIIVNRQTITDELAKLGFFNLQDITTLDAEGNPQLDLSKAKREDFAAMTKLRTKKRNIYNNKGELVAEETDVEVSVADKLRALELLGRDHGMFKPAEQTVVLDVADRLLQARGRLAIAQRSDEQTDDGYTGGRGQGV